MYISQIYDDFEKWYISDPHRYNIDYYDNMIKKKPDFNDR